LSEVDLKRIASVDMLLWNPKKKFSTESQKSASRAAAFQGFVNGDSILVALHPPEVHGYSGIQISATHLQHGRMNMLQFDTIVSDYVNCADRKLRHGSFGEFSYTSGHCNFLELDAQLRRECNCTYDPMAFPMPRCGQLHKGQSLMSSIFDLFSCVNKISTENSVCSLPPCSQTEYAVSPLFYDWGINDFQWKWFWEFATNWEK
uniref:Alpha-1,6-mannosyl-glycoprotein 6-beta-N-acetylglucosaminyltransferase n=1 Tax=Macrostomum lignano TaxID=282301 RepID=A0A1I8G2X5_9PLAT